MNDALTFTEHVGRFWEVGGGNRSQGRLLGWLLVCDPPHQSSKQLQEKLHMSAGAVSTNTRILEGLRMVERMTFPRDRATYYRIAPHAWDQVLLTKFEFVGGLGKIAEEARAVIDDRPRESQARVDQLMELIDFLDIEFPRLIERWEARKERR